MNIKQMRKDAGLTQDELAEAVGVTKQSIVNWENANWIPSTRHSQKFMEVIAAFTELHNQKKAMIENS